MKSGIIIKLFFLNYTIYTDYLENQLSNCPNSLNTIVYQLIKFGQLVLKNGQLDSWTVGQLLNSLFLGQPSMLNK